MSSKKTKRQKTQTQKQLDRNNISYRELSEIVNASYAKTKDIRETMRETSVSFSEVWEMTGMKDYFDFEETDDD